CLRSLPVDFLSVTDGAWRRGSFFLSRGGLHDFEEARRGAGICRVGKREVEGTAPTLALALAGIAGSGVEPPALLTGELPPAVEQGFNVRAFAVLHQRPEKNGHFAENERAEGVVAVAQEGRLGSLLGGVHAAQEFFLHDRGDPFPDD